jgi:hypothetical protein
VKREMMVLLKIHLGHFQQNFNGIIEKQAALFLTIGIRPSV